MGILLYLSLKGEAHASKVSLMSPTEDGHSNFSFRELHFFPKKKNLKKNVLTLHFCGFIHNCFWGKNKNNRTRFQNDFTFSLLLSKVV